MHEGNLVAKADSSIGVVPPEPSSPQPTSGGASTVVEKLASKLGVDAIGIIRTRYTSVPVGSSAADAIKILNEDQYGELQQALESIGIIKQMMAENHIKDEVIITWVKNETGADLMPVPGAVETGLSLLKPEKLNDLYIDLANQYLAESEEDDTDLI